MYDETPSQPVLTSHERSLQKTGPNRGKQHYNVVSPPRNERNDRQGRKPPHKGHPKPAQPKGFCHDQLLQAYKGADLEVVLSDGAVLSGKLIDSDRYVLVLEVRDSREVVFKHAILQVTLPRKAS